METLRQIRPHLGLLVMAVIFGAMLGFLAAHFIHVGSRIASVYTPPQLEQASYLDANSVFVEAYVDSKGRVWNYHVISNGRGAKDLSPQIKNSLIFTTFRRQLTWGLL